MLFDRSLREGRLAIALIGAYLLADLAMLPLGLDVVDEGYFAEQATRVLQGQVPYRDFDSLYTPGLLYLHAGIFAALGEPSIMGMRVLAYVGRVALALSMYVVARPLVRPFFASIPPLVILAGFDLAPSAWMPHPGWLSAAGTLVTVGVVSHLSTVSAQQQPRWLFAVGVLTAIVFVFKQNAGVFLGLSLVVFVLLQGIDFRSGAVSPGVRWAQFLTLGAVVLALLGLMRPHLDLVIAAYLVIPVAALALFAPLQDVSGVGQTLRARVAPLWPVLAGFSVATIPWVALIAWNLSGRIDRLRALVGAVEQAGMFDPIHLTPHVLGVLPGGGLLLLIVALAATRRWHAAAMAGLLSLVVLWVLVGFQFADLPIRRTLVQETWGTAANLGVLLPSAAFWAGLLLARWRGPSAHSQWHLRWLVVSGAFMFLTEYPIVDVPHLAWSAGLLLIVGAVACDRLYVWLTSRPGATPLACAMLFSAMALVPACAVLPTAVDWHVRPLVRRDQVTGRLMLADRVRLEAVPHVDNLWVSPQLREDLASVIDHLRQTTAPGEPIFVYPTSPLLYVLADRPNPTRYGHLYPGTVPRNDLVELVDALDKSAVRTVVLSEHSFLPGMPTNDNIIVEDFLRLHFVQSQQFGAYRVLTRSGGAP